jgi:hypothetical protein
VTDFTLYNHGSICVLTPSTVKGQAWTYRHFDMDEVQMWNNGVVIEPRYVGDILDGLAEDGLTVSL